MNRTSLILTALMFLSLTIFMAPGIFALNRGKILQTIALWLAIFLGLALIYKNFGPDSPHPMFRLPEAMTPSRTLTPPVDNDRG
jgi:hypothetical protein